MSSTLFEKDIVFAQRFLSSCGMYHGKIDGYFGPTTKLAEDLFETAYNTHKKTYGEFDLRSERNIATLHPKMQVAARKILGLVNNRFTSWKVQILSGTRSYAEQDALFKQRPRVTNARGGWSNHNFGIAIDLGIFSHGRYFTGATSLEERAYADLAKEIKSEYGVKGKTPLVEWGGDWKSIKDAPHYQLITGKTVSECRALLEQGKPYA